MVQRNVVPQGNVITGFHTICKALAACVLFLSLQGCVTVIDGSAGSIKTASESIETFAKRATIQQAISTLEQTPWPAQEKTAMSTRMTALVLGGDKRDTASKTSPVSAYVATLSALPLAEQLPALQTDVANHLEAARQLEIAIDQALPDFAATQADILAIENAIASLRATRNVYVGALKALGPDNKAIDARTIAGLKQTFTAASQELSDRADLLAAIADAQDIPMRDDATMSADFASSR